MTTTFALLDHAARVDPYPLYRRLRAADPVHWSEELSGWVLTRFADVWAALHDPRLSPGAGLGAMFARLPADVQAETEPLRRHLSLWMGTQDPPDHTRIRSLMNHAFTPRLVDALRPFIQQTADELIDEAAARGSLDVVGDLAAPLPAIVIAKMLGTPREHVERVIGWSQALTALIGDACASPDIVRAAQASVTEMTGFLADLLAARRQAPPQHDLIHAFLAAESTEGKVSEEEVLANCVMLLFAGHGTITVMIATAVLLLLRHAGARHALAEDPALTAPAIEEFLRFDSPCQMIRRMAVTELTIGERRVQPGDLVWLVLGAANRDPEQFADPDTLDIQRRGFRHLGYGTGIHYCLGAALSRVETEITVNTLLHRLPGLRLAVEEPEWHDDPTARALVALPVAFDIARPRGVRPLETIACPQSRPTEDMACPRSH